MAEILTLTGGIKQFSWSISTNSTFNSSNYTSAGITSFIFTQSSSSISGIVDSISPPASSSSMSTGTHIVTGVMPGTHTYYGFLQDKSQQKYWPVPGPDGRTYGVTVTVKDEKKQPPWFEWSNTVYTGYDLIITAKDWKTLTDDINIMLEYMDWDPVSFTTVTRNETEISAKIVNEAIGVLNQIITVSERIEKVEAGQVITAQTFRDLAKKYNDKRNELLA